MKREDLIKGLQGLKTVAADEWRQAVEMYPVCEIILWHYLRELYRNDDITFERELMRLGLRLSDKGAFYRFMIQKKVDYAFPELATTTGDWFEEEEKRSDESKASLLDLARKLKEKRIVEKAKREAEAVSTEREKEVTEEKNEIKNVYDNLSNEDKEVQIRELINTQKYSEALEILRSINLSNSKKSATFAVQIKWLETIINYK